MLDDHFRKEHFTCDEAECKEKRVVFKSLFDLQAHKRQVHSGQSLPGGGSSGDIHGMAPSSNTRTTANASAARGMEEFPSLGGPSHAQSAARSLLSLSPSLSLSPISLSSPPHVPLPFVSFFPQSYCLPSPTLSHPTLSHSYHSIRRRATGPPTSATEPFPSLGEGGGGGALSKGGPAPGLGLGPAAKGQGPGGASTGTIRSSTSLSMLSALTNGLNSTNGGPGRERHG